MALVWPPEQCVWTCWHPVYSFLQYSTINDVFAQRKMIDSLNICMNHLLLHYITVNAKIIQLHYTIVNDHFLCFFLCELALLCLIWLLSLQVDETLVEELDAVNKVAEPDLCGSLQRDLVCLRGET